MTEHTELLALILPPQGRLVVAAADSAGLLPGPGLVLALEHKGASGAQTVAGLFDRQRVRRLQEVLGEWLQSTCVIAANPPPAQPEDSQLATDATVASWLASGAEGIDL